MKYWKSTTDGLKKEKDTKKDKEREAEIDRRKRMNKLDSVTPERQRIAKMFKTHIENAIDELGPGYMVDLQGNFFDTSMRIIIGISPLNRRNDCSEKMRTHERTESF
jgi:hypothetical protein